MTIAHSALDETVNHGITRWRPANAAARAAIVATAAQVDRVAHQLDDDSLWLLTAAPNTWKRIDTVATSPAVGIDSAWDLGAGIFSSTVPNPALTTMSTLGVAQLNASGTGAASAALGNLGSSVLAFAGHRRSTTATAGSTAYLHHKPHLTDHRGFRASFVGAQVGAGIDGNFQAFMGLYANDNPPGNVDPATLLLCCGIGHSPGDANWSFLHNDNSGVCTKIDLGTDYPYSSNDPIFGLEVYVPKGAASWNWKVWKGAKSDFVQSGQATTNVTNNGYVYGFTAGIGNGTTAATRNFTILEMKALNFY
jgi:hypothetical protein